MIWITVSEFISRAVHFYDAAHRESVPLPLHRFWRKTPPPRNIEKKGWVFSENPISRREQRELSLFARAVGSRSSRPLTLNQSSWNSMVRQCPPLLPLASDSHRSAVTSLLSVGPPIPSPAMANVARKFPNSFHI